MFGFKKKYLWAMMVFSALISPFVFFSSSLYSWQTSNPFLLLWEEGMAVVEYTWRHGIMVTKETWQTYFDLTNAAKENRELKAKLAMMQARIMDYDHRVQEASRLRKLLGFSQQYTQDLMVAEVVGNTPDTPFQSLRIAKGTTLGLRIGMPVIAAQGIVGRILRAGRNFSDVQLLADSNFNLDVIVERTRVRGVLRGVGDNRCRLILHRRADIRISDTIVTSGIAGSFPKGLPVGRVTRISYESDNVSQVITIQPWIDHHGLEEVLLLKYPDKVIEAIKDLAGERWLESSVGALGQSAGNW